MVSIVITLYNKEKYVSECIQSVIDQSFTDIEIIVVNDKTTDSSRDIVASFNDNRIKIIDNPENVGAGMSRRIGIEHATGKYVILLDADDYISQDYIKVLVEHAEESNADIVSGNIIIPDNEMFMNVTRKTLMHNNEFFVTQDEKLKFKQYEMLSFINNKLIRKRLWDKVEYSGLRFIEDAPTYERLIYHANKIQNISNIESIYYYYRTDDTGLINTSNFIKRTTYQILYLYDTYAYFKSINDLQYYDKIISNKRNIIKYLQFFNAEKVHHLEYVKMFEIDFKRCEEACELLLEYLQQ